MILYQIVSFYSSDRSIQSSIHQNLQQIRRMTLRSKDVNVGEGEQSDPSNRSDHNRQFYEEYKKIFTTGYCLSKQLQQLVQSKEKLWKTLLNYEKKAEEEFKDKMRKEAPEKKKRSRRTADEIEKAFQCQVERCQRSYGSEGSLIQHIKIKHPAIYEEMSKNGQVKIIHSDSGHHSEPS